ncbi:hypothetical protein [Psychroserpens luteus]|uniref:Uncharacterized protein n=1 Tax=Psychroserpens luteus TaxID=1434066 RepID=A0ABW5ZWU2_9FLAO|nr:hypothetical protein [Psychroserpens luteus]
MNFFIANILGPFPWERFQYISVNGILAMLAVIAFFLIINKIFNRQPLRFPKNDNLELEQYTFGFEDTHVNVKKISLSRRIVVYLIAVLLIITPLSELIDDSSSYSIWELIF